MAPTDPDPQETLLAFVRQLERTSRRVDDVDELLTQLATDVATLASREGPNDGSPPRSWLLIEDPAQTVEDLEDLTEWLGRVYLRYHGAALPSCWAWHPTVVEELWWLRQAHREAYAPGTRSVAKAGDWHDRQRPGVVQRLQPIARDCDLSRHAADGDRIQDPPQTPLAGEAGWVAGHWANGGTPLPTATQLAAARFADQRQRATASRGLGAPLLAARSPNVTDPPHVAAGATPTTPAGAAPANPDPPRSTRAVPATPPAP